LRAIIEISLLLVVKAGFVASHFGNPGKAFPPGEPPLAETSFPLDLRFARQIAFESDR
jgi:hypothetical protein